MNRHIRSLWLFSSRASTCNAGHKMQRCRFNPWVRKIPGRQKCNPLQYSCLGNPIHRGARQATVHVVAKSQTQLSKQKQSFRQAKIWGFIGLTVKSLHTHTCTHTHTHTKQYCKAKTEILRPFSILYVTIKTEGATDNWTSNL